MSLVLYIENDNVLELVGLQDSVTDAYVNSASVSVTLIDQAGTTVSGETWPLSLSYVAASNGTYRATLRDTLVLSSQRQVTAKIVADDGVDRKATWEIPLTVKRRTA